MPVPDMPDTETDEAEPRRGLFALIGDLPRLLGRLVQAELDAIKAELIASAKRAGVGIGLVGAAVFLLLIAIVVLVGAAVAGLATVLPFWASALVVGGALIVIAGVLAWAGVLRLRSAAPDVSERVDSIKDDVRTIRGMR